MRRPSRNRRRPAVAIGLAAAAALGSVVTFGAWERARRAPGPRAAAVAFTVEGLHCAFWCSVRLEQAIDALDGARVESVDRERGRVVVRHDPARQSVATLRAVLERSGFGVVDDVR